LTNRLALCTPGVGDAAPIRTCLDSRVVGYSSLIRLWKSCPSSALLGGCCCISFQSLRGCPERAWIHAVWMQCQHLLVKVDRSRCLRHDLVEVAEVGAGFLDVTRRAVGIKHTMTGYHGFRMQGLDCIKRSQPLAPGLFIALGQIGMCVVIDGVSGYDQSNGRNVKRG